ncbi:MAG: hypothetical protein ACK4MU_09030, partial [Thermomonas sp.]
MRRTHAGAALLLVLWIVLLLSTLVAGYALSARIESLQGNGVARQLAAREVARAGRMVPANLEVAESVAFLQPGLQPANAGVFNVAVRDIVLSPLF